MIQAKDSLNLIPDFFNDNIFDTFDGRVFQELIDNLEEPTLLQFN